MKLKKLLVALVFLSGCEIDSDKPVADCGVSVDSTVSADSEVSPDACWDYSVKCTDSVCPTPPPGTPGCLEKTR